MAHEGGIPFDGEFPKRCGKCSTLYAAGTWSALVLVGVQDYSGVTLELRNCPSPCGSTMAIEVCPPEIAKVIRG